MSTFSIVGVASLIADGSDLGGSSPVIARDNGRDAEYGLAGGR